MDLTQRKLTRDEWNSIENPVSTDEKKILNMIIEGYDNINIRKNDSISLFNFVKIERTDENEKYLYQKYFQSEAEEMLSKYGKGLNIKLDLIVESGPIKKIKSADNIRITNLENNIQQNKDAIFEFLLLHLTKQLLINLNKKNNQYAFYLYTLLHLKKQSIENINFYVNDFVEKITSISCKYTKPSNIIQNAYEFIEKNNYILKYEDKNLFPHQKQIFSVFKGESRPRLVLYTAPTGTGKTLSPLGLSNEYRVIFVCVARHIGLALAKSAISMEKKVAFAFGCETASDIRLHYFSAVNYTKNHRSGAIAKVDNSIGSKVEIMICDIQSYLTAMYYMLAFNNSDKIITYWDEPTITMDYENHDLHEIIHRNWTENKIPNMVLSCATLPKEDEIQCVIDDFREKFDNADIKTISSYDCKKSIPILNKDSFCVLPHTFYSDYTEMQACVSFCQKNKTLLRYFDLTEIIRFIEYVDDEGFLDDAYTIDEYFASGISEITMNSLKNYYLNVLKNIEEDDWGAIYNHITTTQVSKFQKSTIHKTTSVDSSITTNTNVLKRTLSTAGIDPPVKKTASNGILITTSDAYTLTDGPTIFLADDVEKIGSFYLQQSSISSLVFQAIMAKIGRNNDIMQQVRKLENFIEEEKKAHDEESGKSSASTGGKNERLSSSTIAFMDEVAKLRKEIHSIALDPVYIPNTKPHQEKWAHGDEVHKDAFIPTIDEEVTKTIMTLEIENNLKVLLLLGIGMFLEKPNIHYMEVMKRLADSQHLFIIIASSDYIYGTNYQFCHGFIGKDLKNMTQQKTLQAMGRIGRNNIQQSYTIRFRENDMIKNLFEEPKHNIEAINMRTLFCSTTA